MRSDFAEIVEFLRRELKATGESQFAEATQRCRQFARAIACLQLCERYEIEPGSRVILLPNPTTMTSSSEFRLIEDQESDDRKDWIEVRQDGLPIRPLPGSLLIERRNP